MISIGCRANGFVECFISSLILLSSTSLLLRGLRVAVKDALSLINGESYYSIVSVSLDLINAGLRPRPELLVRPGEVGSSILGLDIRREFRGNYGVLDGFMIDSLLALEESIGMPAVAGSSTVISPGLRRLMFFLVRELILGRVSPEIV